MNGGHIFSTIPKWSVSKQRFQKVSSIRLWWFSRSGWSLFSPNHFGMSKVERSSSEVGSPCSVQPQKNSRPSSNSAEVERVATPLKSKLVLNFRSESKHGVRVRWR